MGVGLFVLLISAAFLAAWRINQRLVTVGDAILALSDSRQELPDMQAIERLSQKHSGPLKRIALALLSFRVTEQQEQKEKGGHVFQRKQENQKSGSLLLRNSEA